MKTSLTTKQNAILRDLDDEHIVAIISCDVEEDVEEKVIRAIKFENKIGADVEMKITSKESHTLNENGYYYNIFEAEYINEGEEELREYEIVVVPTF